MGAVNKNLRRLIYRCFLASVRSIQAAVEDSSGPKVASDRTLWSNLLGSAKLLRERLSSDPKSSCQLKPGCCGADPAFKQSLEVHTHVCLLLFMGWFALIAGGHPKVAALVHLVLSCVSSRALRRSGPDLRRAPFRFVCGLTSRNGGVVARFPAPKGRADVGPACCLPWGAFLYQGFWSLFLRRGGLWCLGFQSNSRVVFCFGLGLVPLALPVLLRAVLHGRAPLLGLDCGAPSHLPSVDSDLDFLTTARPPPPYCSRVTFCDALRPP